MISSSHSVVVMAFFSKPSSAYNTWSRFFLNFLNFGPSLISSSSSLFKAWPGPSFPCHTWTRMLLISLTSLLSGFSKKQNNTKIWKWKDPDYSILFAAGAEGIAPQLRGWRLSFVSLRGCPDSNGEVRFWRPAVYRWAYIPLLINSVKIFLAFPPLLKYLSLAIASFFVANSSLYTSFNGRRILGILPNLPHVPIIASLNSLYCQFTIYYPCNFSKHIPRTLISFRESPRHCGVGDLCTTTIRHPLLFLPFFMNRVFAAPFVPIFVYKNRGSSICKANRDRIISFLPCVKYVSDTNDNTFWIPVFFQLFFCFSAYNN